MRDVVLVTVDSLRADHVGWHGYDRDTTPHLDSRVKEAHRFTNAFSHACSTRPSFPAILTSSHALMHGGCEFISKDRTLISEAFSDAGFSTAGFHSNLYLSEDFGYNRGWDKFFDSKTNPSLLTKIRNTVKSKLHNESVTYELLQKIFDATERGTGVELGSAYVRADEITDRAIDWAKDTSGPRFLWVHYMDVHHPYIPPERDQRRFRKEIIEDRQAVKLRRKMLEEPEKITEQERQNLIDLYDAEISFVDREVNRLLEELTNVWEEEPLHIITADHGEEFADHARFSHYATYFDEVLHVPFVVNDGSEGEEWDSLIGLLDVSPTLCDLVGIDAPNIWCGRSIKEILPFSETPGDSIVGGQLGGEDERRYFYRDHDWKFIERDGQEYLFNLVKDPSETKNIADENLEKVKEIREKLKRHKDTVEKTRTTMESVEMDETVKKRLRDLGYQE